MFTHLYLNPQKYSKTQRRDKINTLCLNNLVLKCGFNGFNYKYMKKEEVSKKINIPIIKSFIENIKEPTYELLGYDIPTKLYLDCELEISSDTLFNNREAFFVNFDKYLKTFLKANFQQKEKQINILYADSSRKKNDKYKLSIHVIVNNLGIFKRTDIKNMVYDFKLTLPEEIKPFVDDSVYKGSQLMRIIYSPNLSKDSILKPFIIINEKVVFKDINYLLSEYTNSLCADYNNNLLIEYNKTKQKIIKSEYQNEREDDYNKSSVVIENWKINWIKNNNYVKGKYVINNIRNNIVDLRRIATNTFCNICKRNHDRENAFCIIKKNNIIFYCNRNNKGVPIGSWYDNTSNKNKLQENILEQENIRLKEIIKKLEEEIKSMKKINYYIPHEKTNHIVIKKNKESIIQKYYDGYKLLIDEKVEEFNNFVRGKWKDNNISRLKERCHRVYKLVEYMKENNIEKKIKSLRSIFNVPDWEFSTLLKKNMYFI